MHVYQSEQIPFSTLRQALFVMGFCFLPHLLTAPWWLSILVIAVISYRLLASYRFYPLLPWWLRASIVIIFVGLLRWHYASFASSGFFINTLVTFFWLKIIETYTLRDLRVVILCSFYVIFTALVIHSTLWIIVYMIAATFADVSLLLKMEAPAIRFKQTASRSMKLLFVATPIAALMFFVFPRITNPLWQVNMPHQGGIGFTDVMSPGSFSKLFPDDSVVMRITFNNRADPNAYWQGLVLNYYDGLSWTLDPQSTAAFQPLKLLQNKQAADYEILLEPHQKNWLFYKGNPISGLPELRFSPNSGLVRGDGKPVYQRFTYSVKSAPPHYEPLSEQTNKQNLQLPNNISPRLRAWAVQERSLTTSSKDFVVKILQYIHQKPFWYKLDPVPIGKDYQQLDRFWFDTREGYCEHYASAVTFILRAAGIPARVIVGYYGGEWNPLAEYLNVRQSNAHAWVQYWREGKGWQEVDPSAFIASQRIDRSILEQGYQHDLGFSEDWERYRSNLSWTEYTMLSLDSARFFWERWLLFYNQQRQQALLQAIGLGSWEWRQLLWAWVGNLLTFLILGGAWYHWRQRKQYDPLLNEYHKLQQELARFHVQIKPPASLAKQWHELAHKRPELHDLLFDCEIRYEELRLQQHITDSPTHRKATRLLFKSLRKKLKTL